MCAKLWDKIMAYKNSELLGPRFDHLPLPKDGTGFEGLKAYLESIQNVLLKDAKRKMVDSFFEKGCKFTEAFCVNILKLDYMLDSAQDIMEADDYSVELEEIAIEMGNGWIPGAKTRLLYKIISAAVDIHEERQYSNYDPSQPPITQQNSPERKHDRKSPPRSQPGNRGGRRKTRSESPEDSEGIPRRVGRFDSS